jgi:hypothetical protein
MQYSPYDNGYLPTISFNLFSLCVAGRGFAYILLYMSQFQQQQQK